LPAEAAARWIAFDADRVPNNRDIYLVRADGSQTVRLTSDPTTEADPAISNDGTTLAFASDRSGTMQIYAMNLATKAVTQLTSLQAGADQPSWSRDNSQIAFHSAASVYLMNADGSNARILHTGVDANLNADRDPSFSADDKQVVFDRGNEIDALDVDGTGFRYIVQNWTTQEETPAVSPDGVTVAFGVECSSTETEQIELTGFACYLFDPCKGELLTPMSAGAARRPAWGPAGVIAFEHGKSGGAAVIAPPAAIGVSSVSAPGSPPCDLVTGPGDSRNPNWAPAGFQPQ
jgi:dipeptidyl aminopeptidase/acylaminoacyl peptidase